MDDPLLIAKNVIDLEIDGLFALRHGLGGILGDAFISVTALLGTVDGRIVVTGMGKSGHVGRKIASTLASTGAPALFVHPGEASHGDLGMIARNDAVLALSKSGETDELSHILAYAKRFAIPVAAITGRAGSSLAQNAEAAIILPPAAEACGETRAPTTSTTMMLALGDAIAITLLRGRGFTAVDFQDFHPGGNLGAALRRVGDLMHAAAETPLCPQDAPLSAAVSVLEKSGLGCVGLVDDKGDLTGVITDGDLRRRFAALDPSSPAQDYMTRTPRTVTAQTLAGDALRIMSEGKITALFVLDRRTPVGLLHIHDCLALGVL